MRETRTADNYVLALNQLRKGPDILLELNPAVALSILSALQLALRHPEIPDGPVTAVIHKVAQKLQHVLIARAPDIRPLIELGWLRDDEKTH